jgi:hypothetical protein
MEKTYWTTKDGRKIDVDTMDVQHLRNTLKMIINNQVRVQASEPVKAKFEIHGFIARDFIDQEIEEDYSLDYDDDY